MAGKPALLYRFASSGLSAQAYRTATGSLTSGEDTRTEWGEPVTDEVYAALK